MPISTLGWCYKDCHIKSGLQFDILQHDLDHLAKELRKILIARLGISLCVFSYLYKPKQCHQTDLACKNGAIMGYSLIAVEITPMCITVYSIHVYSYGTVCIAQVYICIFFIIYNYRYSATYIYSVKAMSDY